MQKKLSQRDLCVLYIAKQGGWVRAYELKGKRMRNQLCGSEADKRMYEVMEVVREKGYYEVEGKRYVIEPGKEGKFTTYRVLKVAPKPRPVMYVRHPVTGERITTEELAAQ